jgi:hypothetical protein
MNLKGGYRETPLRYASADGHSTSSNCGSKMMQILV